MRPIYLFEVLVIAMHSGRNLKVFLNKLPIWEYPFGVNNSTLYTVVGLFVYPQVTGNCQYFSFSRFSGLKHQSRTEFIFWIFKKRLR